MSEANGKVCCNCRHCKRTKDKIFGTVCSCEINDDKYLGYTEVMTGWCRHWAKERKVDESE